MINYYLNEPVEIITETESQYEIKYADGWVEWVDQNEVTSFTKIKRSKIKKSNPKRKAENFKKHYGSVERVEWIKAQPCIICRGLPSQNAHVISRSSGGTFSDIVPLCQKDHSEQHRIGIDSFQAKYQVNLIKLAKYYNDLWNGNGNNSVL